MSTINISDLPPSGYDLFSDSETYLNELTNDELSLVSGGDLTTAIGGGIVTLGASLVAAGVSSPACLVVAGSATAAAAVSAGITALVEV